MQYMRKGEVSCKHWKLSSISWHMGTNTCACIFVTIYSRAHLSIFWEEVIIITVWNLWDSCRTLHSNKVIVNHVDLWNLSQFVVHWSLILMASVQITPQKRKLACLVFGRFRILSTMRNLPKTKCATFHFCAIISTGAVKLRPQWTTNWLRFHIYMRTC